LMPSALTEVISASTHCLTSGSGVGVTSGSGVGVVSGRYW
jgi:hypothetical protein